MSKGYGFVRILTPGDKYENDVFVHQSNIHPQRSTYRTLRESETVRFNLSVETDESVTPQVVELVGVNGRLYCDFECADVALSSLVKLEKQMSPKAPKHQVTTGKR